MNGVVAEDVDEATSKTTGVSVGEGFECGDAAFDIDERLFMEGTEARNVVDENDGTGHTAQAEHVGIDRGESMFGNHFIANVGH